MARKKSFDYFAAMEQLATNGHLAAKRFSVLINDYSEAALTEAAAEIHALEKEGDQVIAELTNELYDSFITPIDREDILIISERLDDILDGIMGLTYLFENLVIKSLRPETADFAVMIEQATQGVQTALKEFPKFKNSKTLRQMINDVNRIESEADLLYSKLKKALFTDEKDDLEIIKWKDIYDRFETIINDTEGAVDIIDGMVIKNT